MAIRSSRFSGRYSDRSQREIDDLLDHEAEPFDETQQVAYTPSLPGEPPVVAPYRPEQLRELPGRPPGLATGPGLLREPTAALEDDFYVPSPSEEVAYASQPSQESQETVTRRGRRSPPSASPHSQGTGGPLGEVQSETTELDEMLGAVLGSYRILSLLGEGGMGRVYLAEHVKLGRKVALKLLRPEYAVKRDSVQRFFNEAQAVNRIGHENIVDITDFVELPSGETFIIMELLQGEDLSDLQRRTKGPMPLHQAMQIALQVCDALEAAHRTGIVHRDLKPDNIFIVNTPTRRDFVKLLDFGVAKLLGESGSNSSLQTAVGSVIGTPAYMSPEQATAIPVDHRSDIYSLGAILYELFTGHPVFRAKSFGEYVVKHMNDEPIRPRDLQDAPSIPMALEQVILRCLEKDPDRRYPSVTDLRDDLARATATVETVLDARALRQLGAARTGPRRPLPRALLLIPIILGVAALAVGAFWLAAGLSWEDVAPARPAIEPPGLQPDVKPADHDAPLATPLGGGLDRQAGGAPSARKQRALSAGHAALGTLSLITDPPGAAVYQSPESDRSLGRTPLALQLPLGETVTLEFRREGYQPSQREVRVQEETTVSLSLSPMPTTSDTGSVAPDPGASKVKRRPLRRQRDRSRPPTGGDKTRRQINPNEIVNPFE